MEREPASPDRRNLGSGQRTKGRPTPRRGKPTRPRRRSLGYWLRRPEPTIATSVMLAMTFLLLATAEPTFLIVALTSGVAGAFVWWTREVWRDNAEAWRQQREEAM